MHLMKTRLGLTAGVALLCLTATPALAQDSGFAERIDVELVNVDVWVSDSKGNPVTGLEAKDFEVVHDGRKVPVTHFTEVRGGAAIRGAAVEPTAYSPSHVVVYFDQSRIHPRNYPSLVRGLEEFLTAEGVEPERVLVMRQVRSLFVEAPFGSTRSQLEKALERVTRGAPSGLDLETETDQALEAIRDSWRQSDDSLGSATSGMAAVPDASGQPGSASAGAIGGVESGAGPDACGFFATQVQPILAGFSHSRSQRIAVSLANLSDTVSFVAGLPGVKALLYLSDGLDTQPGMALASYAGSLCPAAGADLMSGALADGMTAPFLELTRHANTNRVTIYSLQPTGLTAPGAGQAKTGRGARGGRPRSRGAFEASRRSGQREGLGLIAQQTGGRAIFNQNDLAGELARIGQDLGTYYSLAYSPPAGEDRDDAKKRREHQIEVRLADGSLDARYRRGYLEKDDEQWLTERIEGALNLGITNNPLEVRLGAGEIRPGEAGTYLLPLHVMVPAERLAFLPRDESFFAEVTIRVLARGIESSQVAIHDKTLRVKGAPGATGLADLAIELELAAGNHVTAIGVRDEATGEASFISTMLQVGPEG